MHLSNLISIINVLKTVTGLIFSSLNCIKCQWSQWSVLKWLNLHVHVCECQLLLDRHLGSVEILDKIPKRVGLTYETFKNTHTFPYMNTFCQLGWYLCYKWELRVHVVFQAYKNTIRYKTHAISVLKTGLEIIFIYQWKYKEKRPIKCQQ